IVDAVFYVSRAILDAKHASLVGFIFGEKKLRLAFAIKPTIAVIGVINYERCDFAALFDRDAWFARVQAPTPRVAKPKGREQMQLGLFRSAIDRFDPD